MSTARTLRSGPEVEDRKIIDSLAENDDPSADNDGYSFQGAQFLHIWVELESGATDCDVTPWYWSDIAGQWYEGDQLNFDQTTLFALIQVQGESRVYLRLDAVTGGTVSVWGGYSDEQPDGMR